VATRRGSPRAGTRRGAARRLFVFSLTGILATGEMTTYRRSAAGSAALAKRALGDRGERVEHVDPERGGHAEAQSGIGHVSSTLAASIREEPVEAERGVGANCRRKPRIIDAEKFARSRARPRSCRRGATRRPCQCGYRLMSPRAPAPAVRAVIDQGTAGRCNESDAPEE
jgi:hypothetical protein